MPSELIYLTPPKHRLQDLVVFSRVKHQQNAEVRRLMTSSFIMALRGHEGKAFQTMREAIDLDMKARMS